MDEKELVDGSLPLPTGQLEEGSARQDTSDAITVPLSKLVELDRCIWSAVGSLNAVLDAMPEGEQGTELGGLLDGGFPEVIALADFLVGKHANNAKSFNRGYQVVVLMRREQAIGGRDREAWKQDPDEFMRTYRDSGARV